MHFRAKNILKNNNYYTPKLPISLFSITHDPNASYTVKQQKN
jgi:hypothetical protein